MTKSDVTFRAMVIALTLFLMFAVGFNHLIKDSKMADSTGYVQGTPNPAPVNWQDLYLAERELRLQTDSLLAEMTASYKAWKDRAVRLDSTVRDMKIRTDERVAAWQARAVKFQDSLVFWNELYRTCKGRKSEPSFQSQLVQVKYWYNTAENRLRRGDWWKAQYDSLNYAPYICEACGDSINYPQPAPVQGYWDRAWSWIKSWLKLDDE